MRLLIDPQIFTTQEFGGISRYFTELCVRFKEEEDIDLHFPVLYTDNIYYLNSSFYPTSYQNKNKFLIRYGTLFRAFLPRKLKKKNKEHSIKLLQQQSFDLFVPTYYDPYFLLHLKQKPFVLTVHDMIHELYPQYFEDDPDTMHNKKQLIFEAKRIIAVSENTKNDILSIYPEISEDKIDVVHLAHQFSDSVAVPIGLPSHYILFVGNRSLYKNFTFFITAISQLFHQFNDLHLVCAGGNEFDEGELSLFEEFGISSRIIQQNFKDSELKAYYENARCFVFPSEYEGFGIPILEAMSAGCPVILTNNSSFPEIAGDAGIYFELNDHADLRQKVSEIWNNGDLRAEYQEKGHLQTQNFTWEKTASETIKVYHKALSKF